MDTVILNNMILTILIVLYSSKTFVYTRYVGLEHPGIRHKRQGSICGEVLLQSSGIIYPSLQNGSYLANMFCRWEIHAPADHVILLSSTVFAVEQSSKCTWDYLEVRDGHDDIEHSVGRYCGYRNLALFSTSGIMFLYFITDGSFQDSGFIIEYRSIPNDQESTAEFCNRTINSETTITSPYYPDQYRPMTTCFYRIQAPARFEKIAIRVTDISLEDSFCLFDFLYLYDGVDTDSPLILKSCDEIPTDTVIESTGRIVFMIFKSDAYLEDRGFSLEINFIKPHIRPHVPGLECGEVIDNSEFGVVTSPGFPGIYPNNIMCTTLIKSPLPYHRIRLTVTFLELEGAADCEADKLSIFDGEEEDSKCLGTLCGQSRAVHEFTSSGESLRVEFKSDELISWRGFLSNYSLVSHNIVTEQCVPSCNGTENCLDIGGQQWCIDGRLCDIDVCDVGTCIEEHEVMSCVCLENGTRVQCPTQLSSEHTNTQSTSTAASVVEKTSSHTEMTEGLIFKQGDHVFIHCHVNESEPFYTWALNNRLIDDDNVYEHSNGTLEIFSFDTRFVGTYTCLVGTSSTTFDVIMDDQCLIDITTTASTVNVIRDQNVFLKCNVSVHGNITWYKSGIEVDEDQNIVLSEDRLEMTITHFTINDAGDYMCAVGIGENCFKFSESVYISLLPSQWDNGVCGRPSLPDMQPRLMGRISRGQEIEHGTSPWHVIMKDKREIATFCGGTLISTSWLVTAAHCVSNAHFSREFNKTFDQNMVELYLGTELCNGTGGTKRQIKRLISHPRFGHLAPYDNDIALIELNEPVSFTRYIKPICLQSEESIEHVFMNRKAGRTVGRVIGCGRIHERMKATPTYLKDVYVPYVERNLCAQAKIGLGNFTDSMFCAGYSRSFMGDACSGDSGGSLTMQRLETDPWYLVGIVSWGVGCDRAGHYGYYTHVSKFLYWITRTTNLQFIL